MAVPEIYELAIDVKPADIDQLGHVNNVTYVRWVQDAAVAHWQARAAAEDQAGLYWIVLRHEIDYQQAARLGDEIQARTWVGAATRATFERFTELRRRADGVLLAKARTVWCPIDARTRRPVAVSAHVRERFSTTDSERPTQHKRGRGTALARGVDCCRAAWTWPEG
jgi:acyl-CoA thioester hydrolase